MKTKDCIAIGLTVKYDWFPQSGYWLGERDGYYGYIVKGENQKPVCHSVLKKLLEETIHSDFIFIRSKNTNP